MERLMEDREHLITPSSRRPHHLHDSSSTNLTTSPFQNLLDENLWQATDLYPPSTRPLNTASLLNINNVDPSSGAGHQPGHVFSPPTTIHQNSPLRGLSQAQPIIGKFTSYSQPLQRQNTVKMTQENLAAAETHEPLAKGRATRSRGKAPTIDPSASQEPPRRSKRKSDAVAPITDAAASEAIHALRDEEETSEHRAKRSRALSAGSSSRLQPPQLLMSSHSESRDDSQSYSSPGTQKPDVLASDNVFSAATPNGSIIPEEPFADGQNSVSKRKSARSRKALTPPEAQTPRNFDTFEDDELPPRSTKKSRTLSSVSAAGPTTRRASLRNKVEEEYEDSSSVVFPDESAASQSGIPTVLPNEGKTRSKSATSSTPSGPQTRNLRGRKLSTGASPSSQPRNASQNTDESLELANEELWPASSRVSRGSSETNVRESSMRSSNRNSAKPSHVPVDEYDALSQDVEEPQSTKDSPVPSAEPSVDIPTLQDDAMSSRQLEVAEDEQPVIRSRGRPPGGGRGRGGKKASGLVRQNSGGVVKRRGGPGRKKQSDNYLVQAAYERQQDLKNAYGKVARVIRSANERLADICVEKMEEDPLFHVKQSEYPEVMDCLLKTRNLVQAQHMRTYDLKADFLKRQKDMNDDYLRRQYTYAVEEAKEKYVLKGKAIILDMVRNARVKDAVRNGNGDNHDSRLEQPFLNVRWLPAELSDTERETPVDDVLPTSSAVARKGGRPSKKVTPKKKVPVAPETPIMKKQSLLSATTIVDGVEEPHHTQARPSIFGAPLAQEDTPIASSAPTPEPQPNMNVDGDEHGVFIPNRIRRGRMQVPNNRVVVKPWFAFDEDDIGLRSTYAKDGGHAQPATFHFDQYGPQHKFTDFKPGDFDPVMVEKYGLHPVYGIPIPGACNPDDIVPPTDFSKPLPRPRPITFMRSLNYEGGIEQIETSRSALFLNVEAEWDNFGAELDMKKTLKAIGQYDGTFDTPATDEENEVDKAVADKIIDNILQAAKLSDETPAIARLNPLPAANVSRKRGPKANTPGGVPIYETAEAGPRAVAHPMSPPRGNPGALDALADAASIVRNETARRSPFRSHFVPQPQQTIGSGYVPAIFRSHQSPQPQVHQPQQRAIFPAQNMMSQPPLMSPQGIMGQQGMMSHSAMGQQGMIGQPAPMNQHGMNSQGLMGPQGMRGPPVQQQPSFNDMRRPSIQQQFTPAPVHPPSLFYAQPAALQPRTARGSASGLRDILPRPEAHYYANAAPLPPYNHDPRYPPPAGYGGRGGPGYYGGRGQ